MGKEANKSQGTKYSVLFFLSLVDFAEAESASSWFWMRNAVWTDFTAASRPIGFAAASGTACSNFSGQSVSCDMDYFHTLILP